MAMPIGGVRRPVTITDCDGNEVTITDGKLDVNATISVAGDEPSMFTATQNLAAGPLDSTDGIVFNKKVLWFVLKLSAALVQAQTLTITFDSADGAAFDGAQLVETLPVGTTQKYYAFPCDTLLRAGDHYRYQLTNTGAAETAVASLSAMYGV